MNLPLPFPIGFQCLSPLWQEALPDRETLALTSLAMACKKLDSDFLPQGELSLVFADDAQQKELNRLWRGQDRSTNVLSFPASPQFSLQQSQENLIEKGSPESLPVKTDRNSGKEAQRNKVSLEWPLGDITLAFEKIYQEAKDQNQSLKEHVSHLIIHGFLHLLGYNHEGDMEANKMETLEIEIMKALGYKNPYQWKENKGEKNG